jgi:hypothetical protein
MCLSHVLPRPAGFSWLRQNIEFSLCRVFVWPFLMQIEQENCCCCCCSDDDAAELYNRLISLKLEDSRQYN